MNGDRQREIAYHDLERLEDEQALLRYGATATESGFPRDAARASTRSTPVQRGWTPTLSPWLTDHERTERWPIG